jgi:hypothetical protein
MPRPPGCSDRGPAELAATVAVPSPPLRGVFCLARRPFPCRLRTQCGPRRAHSRHGGRRGRPCRAAFLRWGSRRRKGPHPPRPEGPQREPLPGGSCACGGERLCSAIVLRVGPGRVRGARRRRFASRVTCADPGRTISCMRGMRARGWTRRIGHRPPRRRCRAAGERAQASSERRRWRASPRKSPWLATAASWLDSTAEPRRGRCRAHARGPRRPRRAPKSTSDQAVPSLNSTV